MQEFSGSIQSSRARKKSAVAGSAKLDMQKLPGNGGYLIINWELSATLIGLQLRAHAGYRSLAGPTTYAETQWVNTEGNL